MHVSREAFDQLVREAVEGLPQEFLERLDNCDVVTQDWPSRRELAENGLQDPRQLLGLYVGVPLTDRASYGMVLPDKITIYQRPIEAICLTREDVVAQVRHTVAHEIAHHFGISDERLRALGLY